MSEIQNNINPVPAPSSRISQIAMLPTVPNFAGNRIEVEATETGITAVLFLYNKPLTLLIMSPELAKSTAKALLDAVKDYESKNK